MYSLQESRERGELNETFKYMKAINKVKKGGIFNMNQRLKTLGHNL